MKYFILFFILLSACQPKEYVNQDNYSLTVNESIELYYKTNSCCFYCVSNQESLNHLEIVGQKTIDSGPSNSDGGTTTEAFVIKGKSTGTDTLYLKKVVASEECKTGDTLKLDKYVIKVL